jgi:hypothetical protein
MQDFTQSFDARDWAKAFVEHVTAQPSIATDEGTMISWFANAIMRGFDEHARRYPADALINAVAKFDQMARQGDRVRRRNETTVVIEAFKFARPHVDHDALESRPMAEAHVVGVGNT